MPPERTSPVNTRLRDLRVSLGYSQTEFAERFFKTILRTYQRWESTPHAKLPGPVRVIIEALERGGKLPK